MQFKVHKLSLSEPMILCAYEQCRLQQGLTGLHEPLFNSYVTHEWTEIVFSFFRMLICLGICQGRSRLLHQIYIRPKRDEFLRI